MKYLRCINPTKTLTKNSIYLCKIWLGRDQWGYRAEHEDLKTAHRAQTKNDFGDTITVLPSRFKEVSDNFRDLEWSTATGTKIKLRDLDTDHLNNIILMLERWASLYAGNISKFKENLISVFLEPCRKERKFRKNPRRELIEDNYNV